jgi:Dockerin type I domain/Bacterial Ig domain
MGKRSSLPSKRVRVQRRLLVERLGQRQVLAAITGAVFDDANFSLEKESAEVNVPSRLIYVDANNNALFEPGEAFTIAEEDGTFEFPNLADGTYLLRLFNGTKTQIQTTPVETSVAGNTVPVADAFQLELGSGISLALTSDSVVLGNLVAGTQQSAFVGQELTRLQSLPDGTLLVVGAADSGETAWLVDPTDSSVTAVDLSGEGQSIPWSTVALDADGRGVLLEKSDAEVVVRTVDASTDSLQVATTAISVPAATQVLASNTGNRSVFAWEGTDGLQLSLWSNATPSFITETPIDVSGATELLAYDDASGLLAVRTVSGISVLDADANFAALHAIDTTGPVAIDGGRDLLFALSPADSMLKLINLRDGSLVADLAIDLTSIGEVSSLTLSGNDSLVALGSTGMTEVSLRSAAQQVTISGGQDVGSVLFGVSLNGANSAPVYTTLPSFETNEDTTLTLPAPAAMTVTVDAEDDQFVLLQRSQPQHGAATLNINGSVSYVPEANFNGTDSVKVVLHDGRDVSAEVTLQFTVQASPDAPTGVNITLHPLPENVPLGDPVAIIEVIDVDQQNNHIIRIDDPRFIVNGGNIIFFGGVIDFESEPTIPLVISVGDPDSDDIERLVTLTVQDRNDPITGITPTRAFVQEELPGAVVTALQVIDEDPSPYQFSVDDSRFEVKDGVLRLVEGVAVDFETEPEIIVNVTATELADGNSYTQSITISVQNVAEPTPELSLSNDTVLELSRGAIVGTILVDNQPPSGFTFTVDDGRFEVDPFGVLKLLDNVFVQLTESGFVSSEEEILLHISGTDNSSSNPVQGSFLIHVVANGTPHHNHGDPFDVDHGGTVTSLDALAIINYLNTFGPGPVGQGDSGLCYDVNADGFVTALDALLVLNQINRLSVTGGTVGGENEAGPEGELIAPGLDQEAETDQQKLAGDLQEVPLITNKLPSPRLVDVWIDELTAVQKTAVAVPTVDDEQFAENVDATLRLLTDENA